MSSHDSVKEKNVQFSGEIQESKSSSSSSSTSLNSRQKERKNKKAAANKRLAIVWHKVSDLRFHDHEPLVGAHMNKNVDFVLHVHLRGFETKISRVSKLPRICPIRVQFWQESLLDLDDTFRTKSKHQYLMVIDVNPQNSNPAQMVSQIFVDLILKLKTKLELDVVGIYTHDDFCTEEVTVLKKLQNTLQNLEINGQNCGIQVVRYWGGLTVHHLDDVRKIFEKGGIPDLYKPFQNSLKMYDLKKLRPPINLSSGRRLKPAPNSDELIQALIGNDANSLNLNFDDSIQIQSSNSIQQNQNDRNLDLKEAKKNLNVNLNSNQIQQKEYDLNLNSKESRYNQNLNLSPQKNQEQSSSFKEKSEYKYNFDFQFSSNLNSNQSTQNINLETSKYEKRSSFDFQFSSNLTSNESTQSIDSESSQYKKNSNSDLNSNQTEYSSQKQKKTEQKQKEQNSSQNKKMWFTVNFKIGNNKQLHKQIEQLNISWKITEKNQNYQDKIQIHENNEQLKTNQYISQNYSKNQIEESNHSQNSFSKKRNNQSEISTEKNSFFEQNSQHQLNKYEKYWKNKGGEKPAFQYLKQYIWDSKEIRQYVGASDSMHPGKRNAINSTSNFSPWLAFGNLSPRLLMFEIQQFEKNVVKNRSTYWIWHELVFRDFFRFSAKFKFKSKMFKIEGPYDLPWKISGDKIEKLNKQKTSRKESLNNSPKSVIDNHQIFENGKQQTEIQRSTSLDSHKTRKIFEDPKKVRQIRYNLSNYKQNKNNIQKFMNWRVPGKSDKKAQQDFERWITGTTGYPFIDAGMRELAHTGYMSHLHRQTCASFLVRDLQIDWRFGAEWFEFCLLDYTPDANWGNWVYRILPRPQLLEDEEWPSICMHDDRHLMTLEILSWPYVHDQHLAHTNTWVPELGEYFGQLFSEDQTFVKECIRSPWKSLERISKICGKDNDCCNLQFQKSVFYEDITEISKFDLNDDQIEPRDEIYFDCNEFSDSDSEQFPLQKNHKKSSQDSQLLHQNNIEQTNICDDKQLKNSQKTLEKQRLNSNFESQRICVRARRDSPYWFTSVNRVNWPEYQEFMTGYAWTVNKYFQNVPTIKSSVAKNDIFPCEIPDYPLYPIVPPLNLEVDIMKIPIDHSWG